LVDTTYIALLVGFGSAKNPATLGVASYRLAQQFLPILVGGIFYATLRIGPWSIERRDRLARLRQLAHEGERGETRMDFLMRVWPKRVARTVRDVAAPPARPSAAAGIDHIGPVDRTDAPDGPAPG
jgi:hypothetical protein